MTKGIKALVAVKCFYLALAHAPSGSSAAFQCDANSCVPNGRSSHHRHDTGHLFLAMRTRRRSNCDARHWDVDCESSNHHNDCGNDRDNDHDYGDGIDIKIGSTTGCATSIGTNINISTSANTGSGSGNDSLSHHLSSPTRYAASLGLSSVEEMERLQRQHQQASERLSERMLSKDLTGKQKHQILCAHRIRFGKSPFVCKSCWSYAPICICGQIDDRDDASVGFKSKVPFDGKVVLWTHHDEWGSASNTGSVVATAVDGVEMLMKGHAPHDERMEELLRDVAVQPFVLWAGNGDNGDSGDSGGGNSIPRDEKINPLHESDLQRRSTYSQQSDPLPAAAVSSTEAWSRQSEGDNEVPSLRQTCETVQDISRLLHHPSTNSKRIVIIAIEGTWRNARRMVSKLEPHIPRIAIHDGDIFWRSGNEATLTKSILSPLRRQRGGPDGNLCTAEAVIAALVGLGMSQEDGTQLLRLVETKIDLTRRYQGKPTISGA